MRGFMYEKSGRRFPPGGMSRKRMLLDHERAAVAVSRGEAQQLSLLRE